MLYLGVDLGTSSVKVLAVDEGGAVVKTASRTYPLSFPRPGWSEQNPADWWEATAACLRELLSQVDKNQVAGLAVGGQMHGLVALDGQDQVIRPHRRGNPAAQRALREGKASLPGGQHRLRRVHGAKAFVDALPRAGTLCKNQENHAAQGLFGLPSHGRAQL